MYVGNIRPLQSNTRSVLENELLQNGALSIVFTALLLCPEERVAPLILNTYLSNQHFLGR